MGRACSRSCRRGMRFGIRIPFTDPALTSDECARGCSAVRSATVDNHVISKLGMAVTNFPPHSRMYCSCVTSSFFRFQGKSTT
jgi:hypothetical protein